MIRDALETIDKVITLGINNLSGSQADQFWIFMSDKEVWIPLYILVAAMLFRRLGWKGALLVIAAAGLTFAACDQCSNLIKDWAERLRPCYDTFMIGGGLDILEKRSGKFGFFSAHAANAFGFAICTLKGFRLDKSLKYRGYGWFILIWASLVAISRIFVGKHFMGDIIVGTAIGIGLGLLFSWIADLVARKYSLPEIKASE